MPSVVYPRNDELRLAMTTQSLTQCYHDASEGLNYLHPDLRMQLEEFVPRYRQALQRQVDARTRYKNALQEKTSALGAMETAARDFVQLARKMVNRNQAPALLLTALELPLSGPMPYPGNQVEWLNWCIGLVRKLESITDPSLVGVIDGSELSQTTAAAQMAVAEALAADTEHQQRQKECAAMRKEAKMLCRSVMRGLRAALLQETDSAQRRIMRRYGVVFNTDAPQGAPAAAPNDAPEETPAASSANEPEVAAHSNGMGEATAYDTAAHRTPALSYAGEAQPTQNGKVTSH